VFRFNSFPHKDGEHATIRPMTLIIWLAIDYHKHCKTAFGADVQAIHSNPSETTCPCNAKSNECQRGPNGFRRI